MRVFVEYWERWFELQPGDTYVGRDQSCAIRLDDEAVSRRHLRLRVDVATQSVQAEDLLSTNGTKLNDRPLGSTEPLKHGDVLQMGHGVLALHILEEYDFRVSQLSALVNEERERRQPLRRDPTTALLATCPSCHEPLPGLDDRCEICSPPKHRRERRREPRIQTKLPVRYKSANAHFSSLVYDISLGGAFIASNVSEPPVTPGLITITPEDGTAFTAECEVKHVMPVDAEPGHPAGFGVRFTTLEYRGRQWIYHAVQEEMTTFGDLSPSV